MLTPFTLGGTFAVGLNGYDSLAHRWLDLNHPYIGYQTPGHCGHACMETYDPNPRQGEVGLGLFYDLSEDVDPDWGVLFIFQRPDGETLYLQGALDDTRAVMISDESLFTVGGTYVVQVLLHKGNKKWPQPCVKMHVIC